MSKTIEQKQRRMIVNLLAICASLYERNEILLKMLSARDSATGRSEPFGSGHRRAGGKDSPGGVEAQGKAHGSRRTGLRRARGKRYNTENLHMRVPRPVVLEGGMP